MTQTRQSNKLAKIPNERAGLGRPSEAKLQLARLPSIIGVGSAQALLAASGSRKVTYTLHSTYTDTQPSHFTLLFPDKMQHSKFSNWANFVDKIKSIFFSDAIFKTNVCLGNLNIKISQKFK